MGHIYIAVYDDRRPGEVVMGSGDPEVVQALLDAIVRRLRSRQQGPRVLPLDARRPRPEPPPDEAAEP